MNYESKTAPGGGGRRNYESKTRGSGVSPLIFQDQSRTALPLLPRPAVPGLRPAFATLRRGGPISDLIATTLEPSRYGAAASPLNRKSKIENRKSLQS